MERTLGSIPYETLHGTAGDGTDVEIRRVSVQDPPALAAQYPDDLPHARQLLDTDET